MTKQSKMTQNDYNKMVEELDKIFYQFDYMHVTQENEREIRCFFAKIRKGIKELKNDGVIQ